MCVFARNDGSFGNEDERIGLLIKSGVMNPEYDQVGRCCDEQ